MCEYVYPSIRGVRIIAQVSHVDVDFDFLLPGFENRPPFPNERPITIVSSFWDMVEEKTRQEFLLELQRLMRIFAIHNTVEGKLFLNVALNVRRYIMHVCLVQKKQE